MKRIGNIYEKIYDMNNLIEAHKNARKGKGYYQEVQFVDNNLDACLIYIQYILKNNKYTVGKYTKKTIIDKGKTRVLMKLPYFPDRIIQWAIMLQVEEYFNKTFCYFTCASVRDRGINRAYNLTERYLKDYPNETQYCLKLDVRKFYDNINHKILKQLLSHKFKDKQLLNLFNLIIDSIPNNRGVPIGSYLSQYFANFYLSYFDHWLKENLKIKFCIRYMDDIIILSNDKQLLSNWFNRIKQYLNKQLNLQIKSNYQIFPVLIRGIDFVGFRFYGYKTLLRKRTLKSIIKSSRKTVKKRQITKKDFHRIFSYYGICRYYGNCFGVYKKYIYPLLSLCRGYQLMQWHDGKNKANLTNKEKFLLNNLLL